MNTQLLEARSSPDHSVQHAVATSTSVDRASADTRVRAVARVDHERRRSDRERAAERELLLSVPRR